MSSVDVLAANDLFAALGELDVCHNRFDAVEAEARLRKSRGLASVKRFCT